MKEELENANVESGADESNNINNDIVVDGGNNDNIQDGSSGDTGGGTPPTDGGGGGNQPPIQCNHNWIANMTTIHHPAIPGIPMWRHHCHNCDFTSTCEMAIWSHVKGFTCTDNFGGFWSEPIGETGGTPAWTEQLPDGTYNCSICGVRR